MRIQVFLTCPLLTGTPTMPSCLHVPTEPLLSMLIFFMSPIISVIVTHDEYVKYVNASLYKILKDPSDSARSSTGFIYITFYANEAYIGVKEAGLTYSGYHDGINRKD